MSKYKVGDKVSIEIRINDVHFDVDARVECDNEDGTYELIYWLEIDNMIYGFNIEVSEVYI